MRGKNELDKEFILNLYLKGLTAREIAYRVGGTVEAVKKCIYRNFKNIDAKMELKRLQAKEQRKEINSLLYKEARKMMSDRNFVKWNRTIYKNDEFGDLVLRDEEELGFSIPHDVPKVFSKRI